MKDAVVAGGSDSVEVEVVLAKVLEMFPTAITQKEKSDFVQVCPIHREPLRLLAIHCPDTDNCCYNGEVWQFFGFVQNI